MDDETPDGESFVAKDGDNAALVGNPQAGDGAGDGPTTNSGGTGVSGSDHGNDEHSETQLEDSTESDEPDDDGGSSESDEPDDDKPEISRARQQAARYRRQLRDVESERDELAAALWTERVAALGVLADPTDLPHDPDALHDPDRLRELADELVAAKPHLRSRRIRERAGQGEGDGSGTVSLSGLLRRNA